MKKAFKYFVLISLVLNLSASVYVCVNYDDGEYETAVMSVARESVWKGRTDIVPKLLPKVKDKNRRQDMLSSLASAYLKSDVKKSEEIAKSIDSQNALDRYYCNRVMGGFDVNASMLKIKSHSIRAYAWYFRLSERNAPTSDMSIWRLCNLLRAEGNAMLRDEFVLKMIYLASENGRFDDVLKFVPYATYSLERNALIINSFRTVDTAGKGLEFKRKNSRSMSLFATYAMTDSILKNKGYDAYVNSFQWILEDFQKRRRKYDYAMAYPIIANFSSAVGRRGEAADFTRKSVAAFGLPQIKMNIETYAEIFSVSIPLVDGEGESLSIFDKLADKKLKRLLLRKYAHLFSHRGERLDEITELVLGLE